MRPHLLDFTPEGQVIINMPNYKDISFLENFGFSPIESVEQEISQADSPERAAFLEHYVKVFKETFVTPPASYLNEADEDETSDFEALDERSDSRKCNNYGRRLAYMKKKLYLCGVF